MKPEEIKAMVLSWINDNGAFCKPSKMISDISKAIAEKDAEIEKLESCIYHAVDEQLECRV